ncbi:hypothetical protein PCANC_07262 [Puccinia coronata f. sp. avenae]|uniref:Uncharacterized protein n=1 Tax=Puccinia coronata f. sp. avenae TaxID=200324 RepID=A0A2N5VS32_9BASI|nr:hypothetical protein PCANC_07262 [Puccinia coronata f. sp. avenae]
MKLSNVVASFLVSLALVDSTIVRPGVNEVSWNTVPDHLEFEDLFKTQPGIQRTPTPEGIFQKLKFIEAGSPSQPPYAKHKLGYTFVATDPNIVTNPIGLYGHQEKKPTQEYKKSEKVNL